MCLLLTVVLGKDEKSGAFVRGYEDDLQDDAMNDFAHLAEDEMEVDENDENEEPVETVDASEVQAQLRLAAQNNKGKGKVSQLRYVLRRTSKLIHYVPATLRSRKCRLG